MLSRSLLNDGPEGATEQSPTQSAERESSEPESGEDQESSPSHESAADQSATTQDSTQQTPPATTTTQGATAPGGVSTPNLTDTSQRAEKHRTGAVASTTNTQGRPDYNWVAQFLKKTHDNLWPSEPVTSASPSLLTGLTLGTSDHLIDNLMEWERKLESANLEGHKQFPQKAGLPICDSSLEATA